MRGLSPRFEHGSRAATIVVAFLLFPGAALTQAASQRLAIAATRTHDVRYGTFEAPDDFTFAHTGTIDSFRGTLTRKSDGFTIHFDIGLMAGTRVSWANQEKFALFRSHTVNDNFAYTGIEHVNGKRTVASTICESCERSRLSLNRLGPRPVGERSQPANFWADFTHDEDLVEFMLIVNSYKTKVIPALPPLVDDGVRTPAGPFQYGEVVDGISLGIRVDTTEYQLNHRIRVWITLRNASSRTLTRNDSLLAKGELWITTPGGWAGMAGVDPLGAQAPNPPIEVGMTLHSLMGREFPATFNVQWKSGGPKPGPTQLGRRQPSKLESGIVTFTVVR
jgi:hypothetical protein